MLRILRASMRSVALCLIVIMTTAACGNLSVPPPFEESSNGWEIRQGTYVSFYVNDKWVAGRIQAVSKEYIRVDSVDYRRSDIKEMWLRRDPAKLRRAAVTVLVMASVLGLIVVMAMKSSRDDGIID